MTVAPYEGPRAEGPTPISRRTRWVDYITCFGVSASPSYAYSSVTAVPLALTINIPPVPPGEIVS